MQVEFLSKFNKDIDRIHLKSVKKSILSVIEEVKSANSLSQIKNIKKLTGFKSAFRIRTGEYRIGIFIEENKVQFARVLNRKEIYRFFP
jgi:mRNA interferase RelE/StbE